MTDFQEIRSAIIETLTPFRKEGASLDGDTRLVNDLGLDSVKVMELLLQVEDHFDISIPLNILPDVHTVDDLARAIHRLMEAS